MYFSLYCNGYLINIYLTSISSEKAFLCALLIITFSAPFRSATFGTKILVFAVVFLSFTFTAFDCNRFAFRISV